MLLTWCICSEHGAVPAVAQVKHVVQRVWWTIFPYLGLPIHLQLHTVLGTEAHPDRDHEDDLIFTFQEDHIFWVCTAAVCGHQFAIPCISINFSCDSDLRIARTSLSWMPCRWRVFCCSTPS